jgi:hypothetical protein
LLEEPRGVLVSIVGLSSKRHGMRSITCLLN